MTDYLACPICAPISLIRTGRLAEEPDQGGKVICILTRVCLMNLSMCMWVSSKALFISKVGKCTIATATLRMYVLCF